MSFGDELRLQLGDLRQYTNNGIAYMSDVRDYLKERIDLEREFADKLDKLSKKYQRTLRKTGVSYYGAGTPFKADAGGGSDAASVTTSGSSEGLNSAAQAWLTMLQQAEGISKAHVTLADSLTETVSKAIKQSRIQVEDELKKHMAFAIVQQTQLDSSKADMEAARDAYKAATTKVEYAYSLYEKQVQTGGDASHVQRATTDWNAAVAEKNERLNEYLLALNVLNAHHERRYEVDQPTMATHIQRLNEKLISTTKEILTTSIRLDNSCLDETRRCNDTTQAAITAMDGASDSVLFVNAIKQTLPPANNEPFTPFSNADQATLDTETSRVQLLNALLILRTNVVKLDADIVSKKKEIDALTNLRATYAPGSAADFNTHDQQLDYERQLLTLELAKVKAKVQLEDIEGALGNVEVRAHETKSTTSGTCAVCNSGFNFLSKGLQCTVCDMRYHPSKCVLKVPPCGHQVMAQPPSATPIAAERLNQGPAKAGATGTLRSTKTISRPRRNSTGATGAPVAAAAKVATSATKTNQPVRYATVLYDFSKTADVEITVNANDRVKVLQVDDGKGWMTVEIGGVSGLVPTNYCDLDPESSSPAPAASPAAAAAAPAAATLRARALYDYEAQAAGDLTVHADDVIEITNPDVGGGWMEGKLKGKTGQFPANYVEMM